MQRADANERLGQHEASARLRQHVYECHERRFLRCPSAGHCRLVYRAPGGDPAAARPAWRIGQHAQPVRPVINNTEIHFGVGRVRETSSGPFSHYQMVELETDVVRAFEGASTRALLSAYQAKSWPTLAELRSEILLNEEWDRWTHIMPFVEGGDAFIQRFAPGMITLSGQDATGSKMTDLPFFGAVDILLDVNRELIEKRSVHFSQVTRSLEHIGAVRHASMSRLLLPFFEGTKVAGALVHLSPQRLS